MFAWLFDLLDCLYLIGLCSGMLSDFSALRRLFCTQKYTCKLTRYCWIRQSYGNPIMSVCIYPKTTVSNSWIKIDQLDVTCFIISLFTAQHVSNVSTSIFRSLRLIVDLFHVLYCSGSMCVGVTVWFGWGGVVSLCRLKLCFSLHKGWFADRSVKITKNYIFNRLNCCVILYHIYTYVYGYMYYT
jgi:hypothetical protein